MAGEGWCCLDENQRKGTEIADSYKEKRKDVKLSREGEKGEKKI